MGAAESRPFAKQEGPIARIEIAVFVAIVVVALAAAH
jgi:hypothetical protein